MRRAPVFLAIALVWEASGRIAGSETFPPLSMVILRFIQSLQRGIAIPHIGATLWRTVLSFALGSLAGVLFGLIAGWFRPVESFFHPLIYFTYSLPRIALIPLFILWLGLGNRTIIVAAAVAVFYLVAITTLNGAKQVDPTLIRAARNLGANQLQVMTKVLLPASMIPIFAATRLGFGQALISVVSGEILIGNSGLGYWIWNARYRMDTPLVFVNLILLALLGYLVTRMAAAIERASNRWQRDAAQELWI